MVQAAREFFHFHPPGALWIGDARYLVSRLPGRYDLIVHDCFTGGSEPVHLLTVEMIEDLRRHLKPDGVLILNFVGFLAGPQRVATEAVHRTLGQVFPHLLVLVSDPAANFNDLVFVASSRLLSIPWQRLDSHQRSWWSSHLFPFETTEGFIISDDYNPLDSLQTGKAEAYRTLLKERLGLVAWLW